MICIRFRCDIEKPFFKYKSRNLNHNCGYLFFEILVRRKNSAINNSRESLRSIPNLILSCKYEICMYILAVA